MLLNEVLSFTGVTLVYTITVFSFFVIGLWLFITGYRKRRRLVKDYLLIPATVTRRHGVKAHLEWTFRGEIFASSPMRLYAVRRGEPVGVFVQYDTGMIEGVDIWSENGRGYYIFTVLCWVVAGIALLVGAQA